MKLITDLSIMEGLGTCRDELEAKAYLMANNIEVSDQELEALQAHCYTETDCKSTLTANQLSTVAGGMKPAVAHTEQKGGVMVNGKYHAPGTYVAEQDSTFRATLTVVARLRVAKARSQELECQNVFFRRMINDYRAKLGEEPLSDDEFQVMYDSSGSSSGSSSPEPGSPPRF